MKIASGDASIRKQLGDGQFFFPSNVVLSTWICEEEEHEDEENDDEEAERTNNILMNTNGNPVTMTRLVPLPLACLWFVAVRCVHRRYRTPSTFGALGPSE